MKLDGAAIIVTGSARGVGAAVARRLAAKGARVAINYVRSRDDAEATAAACRAAGGEAIVVRGDVANEADCRALADAALSMFGRIDALVNNAATTVKGDPFDIEGLSAEDFRKVFDTNVIGAFQMVRAVLPAMRAAGGGAIVNISSNVAETGGGSSIPYTASKGALNSLTKVLARTLGPDIRVNAVAPGIVDTNWLVDALGAEAVGTLIKASSARSVLGRIAQPDDIADPVVWLIEGARYVTGEILMVDGGLRLFGPSRKPEPA